MGLPSRIAVALALAGILLPAAGATEVGVRIGSGHRITAHLGEEDEDAFALPLCEGDQVTLSKSSPTWGRST